MRYNEDTGLVDVLEFPGKGLVDQILAPLSRGDG